MFSFHLICVVYKPACVKYPEVFDKNLTRHQRNIDRPNSQSRQTQKLSLFTHPHIVLWITKRRVSDRIMYLYVFHFHFGGTFHLRAEFCECQEKYDVYEQVKLVTQE